MRVAYATLLEAADAYEQYGLRGFRDPSIVTCAEEGPLPLTDVIELCEARLAAADAPVWRHGYLLVNRASAEAYRGDFETARLLTERARVRLLEFDQVFAERTMWCYAAGTIAVLEGDGPSATAVLRPALDHARERDYPIWRVHLGGVCSEATLLEGDIEAALRLAEEARDAVPRSSDRWLSFSWRSAMARAHLAAGDVEPAEQEARTEIARWEPTDALINKGRLSLLLADVLRAAGRRDEALSSAEDSARLFDEKGATHLAERARTLAVETAEGGAQR